MRKNTDKKCTFYTHDRFGQVPNGWDVTTIGESFEFFPTASYARSKLTKIGDCFYIHYGDIHTKYHRFIDLKKDELPCIKTEFVSRYTKVKEGDLVLADASEDYDGVGKAVEVLNIEDNCVVAGLHTLHLRAKEDTFVSKFKGYLLNHESVRLNILRSATGIKVYGISKARIRKILLPKPPKPEQIAIASILSRVDEAIEATKQSIKAAEKLKNPLMQNLLTGKLKPDGTWRSDDGFYEDKKFGKVPIDWAFDEIRNLTKRVTDGEHLSPDFQDVGAYLLSAEDINDDGVSFDKAKFVKPRDCKLFRNRCNPDFGDVLIVSRGAGIGRTCRITTRKEFCLMGSVILIKPNNNKLHGGFLAQYFKSYKAWVELQKLSGTTAQQAIYLTHIKKVKLIYPIDPNEQENISAKLESFDKNIAHQYSKIKTLERLKKSLMQNLLTGKIRVDNERINQLVNE